MFLHGEVFTPVPMHAETVNPKMRTALEIVVEYPKAELKTLARKSMEKIVKTAKNTGALVLGPIPLPTKRSIFTVNRSPHVDKKSREQFQIKIHKRIVDLMNSTSKTVDALMQLDMPAGVDIEIKT